MGREPPRSALRLLLSHHTRPADPEEDAQSKDGNHQAGQRKSSTLEILGWIVVCLFAEWACVRPHGARSRHHCSSARVGQRCATLPLVSSLPPFGQCEGLPRQLTSSLPGGQRWRSGELPFGIADAKDRLGGRVRPISWTGISVPVQSVASSTRTLMIADRP